ncbi:helix-turn-helix domain-containing protein [Chitinophaga caeni]|nr:helix-turn-helix transcriptional regulator [Chitinophaga caeni]
MNKMSIGENIKEIRILRHYTQSYVAKQLKMSTTAYGNIERDKVKELSIFKLVQIADVFGVSVVNLIDFDHYKYSIGAKLTGKTKLIAEPPKKADQTQTIKEYFDKLTTTIVETGQEIIYMIKTQERQITKKLVATLSLESKKK